MNNNNFLLDAFTSMRNCKNEEESWTAIHGILKQIGASHLVAAEVTKKDKTILWFRTSMKNSWIEEYLDGQYYLSDTIIRNGISHSTAIDIVCGDASQATDMLERRFNLGLRDAGYGELRAHSFSDECGDATQFATICFDTHKDTLDSINSVYVAQVQSLISVFLNKPISAGTPGLIKFGAHALSPRERDVLAYLSQGMMTAKIADKLGLADVTVNKHFNSAKKRLGAATRGQALAMAMASGAISL